MGGEPGHGRASGDDVAAGRLEVRQRGPDRVDRGEERDVDRPSKSTGATSAKSAGAIVPTCARAGSGRRAPRRSLRPHARAPARAEVSGRDVGRTPAPGSVRRRLESFLGAGDEREVGTLAREGLGGREAEPAGGAHDEDAAAGQVLWHEPGGYPAAASADETRRASAPGWRAHNDTAHTSLARRRGDRRRIVGCAVAAFLAEAGGSVIAWSATNVAAGASGRNSGILQRPMDAALAPLAAETLAHYRTLAEHGFGLAAEPDGILVVGHDRMRPRPRGRGAAAAFPELGAELLPVGEPATFEPALAPDLAAIRLATGHAVPPGGATRAFAARARAAGAEIRSGAAATLAPGGVRAGPGTLAAGAVVVAAGPWTPQLVDPSGAWRPIAALWGVVCELRLPGPRGTGSRRPGSRASWAWAASRTCCSAW